MNPYIQLEDRSTITVKDFYQKCRMYLIFIKSCRYGRCLYGMGLKTGDNILICANNSIQWVYMYMSSIISGFTVTGINIY